MSTETIQRQYDTVIAAHYDLDPKSVIGDSLDTALAQIRKQESFRELGDPLRTLDVGVGTGEFLARLRSACEQPILPFGLDLSVQMIAAARKKLPDLVGAVDDAANLEKHFADERFDLVCTHFITGFVPMQVLAPKIFERLDEGGFWSFVGGTKAGFPALQAAANRRLLKAWFGGSQMSVEDHVCNPAGRAEVVRTLEDNGFAVRECETFEPKLRFQDFDDFMAFAYRGGWLTPFIEAMGLHQAGKFTRFLLNTFVFPVVDSHSIEIVLAQKVK